MVDNDGVDLLRAVREREDPDTSGQAALADGELAGNHEAEVFGQTA